MNPFGRFLAYVKDILTGENLSLGNTKHGMATHLLYAEVPS